LTKEAKNNAPIGHAQDSYDISILQRSGN